MLLRDGGGLVDVRYSASCGGHGEDNDAIWGGPPDPSLRGRPDTANGGMTRITDANVAAFLGGGGDAWCAQGKLGKGRFRWTESLSSTHRAHRGGASDVGAKALVPRRRRSPAGSCALAIRATGRVRVTGVCASAAPLRLRSTLF